MSGLTIGIDATNLRLGGGVTHLVELLGAASPADHGVDKVIVWSGDKTLSRLPARPWLDRVGPAALNGGLVSRTLWQWRELGAEARRRGCDLIFAPGGSYSARFRPVVTMSQNLLPFEWGELSRYGLSVATLRLLALRFAQSRSFRRADGVIYLTDYAKAKADEVTGLLRGRVTKIPHGLPPRFSIPPRPQRKVAAYSAREPLRIVYVSMIDLYKHQWHVVNAVHQLRQEGIPVTLDLIGPAYLPALKRLMATIDRVDPHQSWVRYLGEQSYETIHRSYENADLSVFASSCETFGIILLEMMAAGLPIASSGRGAMPEVLADAGVYFDPESSQDIARSLRELFHSPERRSELAARAFQRAQTFSWADAADHTFAFLAEIARSSKLAK